MMLAWTPALIAAWSAPLRTTHNLAQLSWSLSGWTPYFWRFSQSVETGSTAQAEIPAIPAKVPGSVQAALRDAGLLPDWNAGLNSRPCEWVENRHWIFEAALPDDWVKPLFGTGGAAGRAKGFVCRLKCLGLDYSGCVLVNAQEAGSFRGSFVPHEFDLTEHLKPSGNRLRIVFECPPRWLGQFGHTSRMAEWKPRFNYGWDWTSRLVQIGVWDELLLEVSAGHELRGLRCLPSVESFRGRLSVRAEARGEKAHTLRVTLEQNGRLIRAEDLPAARWRDGVHWRELPVELWHPNGSGSQPLYTFRVQLLDANEQVLDEQTRRVGFKRVEWKPCAGAPPKADPWLCVVNNTPVFLQGVNWTPIRPNFADLSLNETRKRLLLYRNLGCNLLRVWGGGYLEKEWFYDLCDELGLLVWQEFPLSSSGLDNWPPEGQRSIAAMEAIAVSYIERRQHHASLLLWCGGNELQHAPDKEKEGTGRPLDLEHPMLKRLDEIVAREDPSRRFLPTSSSGPRFTAEEKEFGQGLHWDVHGPWRAPLDLKGEWTRYWEKDDALFRSETGHPGASPVDIIREYAGGLPTVPGTLDNPLWRRTPWWLEWAEFAKEQGREPRDLEEYVAWSQARQRDALVIAARACKNRFPRCGGILIWMGHDCFPCLANTAIVDFRGRPKPAALGLAEVFKNNPPSRPAGA
jgi:beta-mannosidase